MSFSIYNILTEAPEDQQQQSNQQDDNFDIDTSLDDIDDDNATGTDGTADEIDDDEDIGVDGEDEMEGEEGAGEEEVNPDQDEPVQANTDMFGSLSKEEQMMKIRELKNQYANLYDACDDLIEKINDINTDESNLVPISRVLATAENIKTYIADYLYHGFAQKSFFENDVMFNRFLAIFKSISNVLEDVYKYSKNQQNQQQN